MLEIITACCENTPPEKVHSRGCRHWEVVLPRPGGTIVGCKVYHFQRLICICICLRKPRFSKFKFQEIKCFCFSVYTRSKDLWTSFYQPRWLYTRGQLRRYKGSTSFSPFLDKYCICSSEALLLPNLGNFHSKTFFLLTSVPFSVTPLRLYSGAKGTKSRVPSYNDILTPRQKQKQSHTTSMYLCVHRSTSIQELRGSTVWFCKACGAQFVGNSISKKVIVV